MKVNLNTNNIYTNKLLKRGLKYAANNSGLFVAGTSLLLSSTLRPLTILLTPKTDKENRKIATSKSIASACIDCAIMTAATIPLSKSIKKIDKTPEKYLNEETIRHLSEKGKKLIDSNGYKFSTQLFKLGTRIGFAIPKAILSCALIPPILKLLNTSDNSQENIQEIKEYNKTKSVSFKGHPKKEILTQGISKIINSDAIKKLTNRYKDSNFGMHMMAIADSLTTLTFVRRTKKSKQIKENRKNTLINNTIIATGLSIISGYAIDKSLEKPTNKFIEKFTQANKGSKELGKYIEGIKIAKPALILGGIYYGIIPFISTFLAERTTINPQNNQKNDKIDKDTLK